MRVTLTLSQCVGLPMRYTAEQLQALLNLRASGQLSYQFEDRIVRYQSGADLDAAIAAARRDVAASNSPDARTTRGYFQHGRGY